MSTREYCSPIYNSFVIVIVTVRGMIGLTPVRVAAGVTSVAGGVTIVRVAAGVTWVAGGVTIVRMAGSVTLTAVATSEWQVVSQQSEWHLASHQQLLLHPISRWCHMSVRWCPMSQRVEGTLVESAEAVGGPA